MCRNCDEDQICTGNCVLEYQSLVDAEGHEFKSPSCMHQMRCPNANTCTASTHYRQPANSLLES